MQLKTEVGGDDRGWGEKFGLRHVGGRLHNEITGAGKHRKDQRKGHPMATTIAPRYRVRPGVLDHIMRTRRLASDEQLAAALGTSADRLADLRAGDAVIVWTLPDGQPTAATLDADPAEGPAQPWPPVSGSLLLLGVDKIIAVEL